MLAPAMPASHNHDPEDAKPGRPATILYARPLTSGGYVAIEAHQPSGASYRARVFVERRSDPARREGHAPPIIAEYEGPTRLSVMHELYRVATDDALVVLDTDRSGSSGGRRT